MSTIEDELATRVWPWSERELAWQRMRPPALRTPLPCLGARLWFRFDRFAEPEAATAVQVPDLGRGWRWEDLEPGASTPDPWVWQLRRDNSTAQPVLDSMGLPCVELLPDPQPVIVCRVASRPGLHAAREARLRGSPGWLPLDWRERWRPGPHTGWSVETKPNLIGPQPRIPLVLANGVMA